MIIQKNISLKPYNTFGIEASAKEFVIISSVAQAKELIVSPTFRNQPVLILGGGSNVLLTKNFEGLVVKVELHGKEIIQQTDSHVVLKAGAGENWHQLVMYCVQHNWGGVENLSLIPGTMGAAPMQNIGAYGVEMKDVIESVEAIDVNSGDVRVFTNAECHFAYRESIFKHEARGKYLITGVTLRLTTRDHAFNCSYGAIQDTMLALGYTSPSVKAISDAVIHIRQSKLPDPAVIGNAGSFFKNPTILSSRYQSLQQRYPSIPGYPAEDGYTKVPAGWLIEQCGWKGKTIDSIGVHKHQALVLVNYGGGAGDAIWQLAMDIQASVQATFNITIQPEVNVIG